VIKNARTSHEGYGRGLIRIGQGAKAIPLFAV
jgi:hypothetical protein